MLPGASYLRIAHVSKHKGYKPAYKHHIGSVNHLWFHSFIHSFILYRFIHQSQLTQEWKTWFTLDRSPIQTSVNVQTVSKYKNDSGEAGFCCGFISWMGEVISQPSYQTTSSNFLTWLCIYKTNPRVKATSISFSLQERHVSKCFFNICGGKVEVGWELSVCELFLILVMCCFRYHHGSDNDYHHHRCLSLYAAGVLRQSCGHLLMGKLPVRLSVRHWICCCQLLHHSGGDEKAQRDKGHSYSLWLCRMTSYPLFLSGACWAQSLTLLTSCRFQPPLRAPRLWPLMAVSMTMTLTKRSPAAQTPRGTPSHKTLLCVHPQRAPGYVADIL